MEMTILNKSNRTSGKKKGELNMPTLYSRAAATRSASSRPMSPRNSNTTSDSTKTPLDIATEINTMINQSFNFEKRLAVARLVEELKHHSNFSQDKASLLTTISHRKTGPQQIDSETFNTNLKNVERWLDDPNHMVRLFHLAVYNGNETVINNCLETDPKLLIVYSM